jgi:hypothetical protein
MLDGVAALADFVATEDPSHPVELTPSARYIGSEADPYTLWARYIMLSR